MHQAHLQKIIQAFRDYRPHALQQVVHVERGFTTVHSYKPTCCELVARIESHCASNFRSSRQHKLNESRLPVDPNPSFRASSIYRSELQNNSVFYCTIGYTLTPPLQCSAMRAGIDANALFLTEITAGKLFEDQYDTTAARDSGGVGSGGTCNPIGESSCSADGLRSYSHTSSNFDMGKVRSTLRQYAREWSVEGEVEREQSFGRLLRYY